MEFATLILSLALVNIQILISAEECSVSSNYNSEIQDLKNTVALLQMQLDIRTVLNDLKDNLYKQQKIKQIILKEIETLIDNRLTTSKREIIDEIEKRQPQCQVLPTDCKDVQSRGNNTSGIYLIKPEASKTSFRVWCDMTTRGGGWVYVINRFDGSQDFYLNWPDYKYGFGDITKEFWLGLEHLYELTNSKANELLVELVDWSDHKAYANYKFFEIGDESEGYYLKSLGDYSGDAGDSFHPDAATKPKFSTKDKDQDQDARNCATVYPGAWWHTKCFNAHLMGKYRPKSESNLTSDQFAQGIHWKEYRGYYYSLKEVRMMLRPQEIFKHQSFFFNIHILDASEANNQKYVIISTSPSPSEDLKNPTSKLQNQLENPILNELINQIKNIRQEILSDIEKLDNKFKKLTPEIESIKRQLKSLQKDKNPPSDCKDVQNQGDTTSGVYLIKPNPLKRSIRVWCDMTTRGGGWTYVINRFDGSQDFYLKWANYKFGFGNASREYWIGLESLHQITSNKPTELLVELVDWEDKKARNYKNFEIGSEAEGFNLKNVGDYSGDAGDCMMHEVIATPKFTTKDKDQDTHATINCANLYPGAWWHHACFRCHLTGRYRYKYESNLTNSQVGQGIHWWDYKNHLYSLKEARMMVRPQDIV